MGRTYGHVERGSGTRLVAAYVVADEDVFHDEDLRGAAKSMSRPRAAIAAVVQDSLRHQCTAGDGSSWAMPLSNPLRVVPGRRLDALPAFSPRRARAVNL